MDKNLGQGTEEGLVRPPKSLTKTDYEALPMGWRGSPRQGASDARGALPSPMIGSGKKRKAISLRQRHTAGPWAPLPVLPAIATLLPHQGRERGSGLEDPLSSHTTKDVCWRLSPSSKESLPLPSLPPALCSQLSHR